MSREAMLAVVFGAASGLLFLSLLSGSLLAILLVNLAQLPLFLAGLWLGPHAAAIAGVAGALGTFSATSLSGAMVFVSIYAVPVVLLSWQALRWREDEIGQVWWYPPGRLIATLVGLGMAGIAFMALLTAGEPGGFEGSVRSALEQQTTAVFGAHAPETVPAIAALFPGAVAATWALMTAVNGALAQRLLAWWNKNRRPTPSISEIEMPGWVVIALGLAFAAAVFLPGTLGYLGRNMLPVLTLGFFAAGLAVVHCAAHRFSAAGPLLGAIYALILFVWPVAVAVAALGLIEQWAGFRRRLAGQGE